MPNKTLLLSHAEISLKIDRIAWQILEDHYAASKLVLIGIEARGAEVAKRIANRLHANANLEIVSLTIALDKRKPLETDAVLSSTYPLLNEAIILIDDVLNSGKTMAAALKEILSQNPKSIKTAVLANRDHHKFPVQANYVGVSLATTLKEHISYEENADEMNIYLS